MNRFPDITMETPEEVKENTEADLEIINYDNDLEVESPFITLPKSIAQEPEDIPEIKEIIPKKKEISEKQKAHLESMRERARLKKLGKNIKTTKKEDKLIEQAEISQEDIEAMNQKEFDK